MKKWREANKQKIKEDFKVWVSQNKDKIKLNAKNYRQNNKDHVRAYKRSYIADSLKEKLSHNLRVRLNDALKGRVKSGSAVKDLGCSVEELKSYLESKFQPGMSWENYGPKGWHIDHVVPLSKYDLTDQEQLRIACNYANLQPLWWHANLAKGSKDE